MSSEPLHQPNDIIVGKKVYIRNEGKDEYWLQSVIYESPEKLGLGELVPVRKEKTQISGGRLDILLKDPSDNSMYEVEVMLGETDPSHIIRCIEYWDNEKRRYPQRQHFAVLVAESFDRRYFNVIQILSLNVPMIAIQADLIQTERGRILHFTKVLDIYQEPQEEEESKPVSASDWSAKAPWVIDVANALLTQVQVHSPNAELRYTQTYVSIIIANRTHYYIHKRSEPFTSIAFVITDEESVDRITEMVTGISGLPNYNSKYKQLYVGLKKADIDENSELFQEAHRIKMEHSES